VSPGEWPARIQSVVYHAAHYMITYDSRLSASALLTSPPHTGVDAATFLLVGTVTIPPCCPSKVSCWSLR